MDDTPVIVFDVHDELVMLARLGVALACGFVLGIERRRESSRPAGIRTLTLVTGGAAVFMLVSQFAFGPGTDPGRIAAQVVSGVGFLGAGVLILSRGSVRNLATAAAIWIAAAIGLAAGAGLFVLAGGTTVAATIVLFFAKPHPVDLPEVEAENVTRPGANG